MTRPFNEEEMTFLASIEPKLRTAVDARWVSRIAPSTLDVLFAMWTAVTGEKRTYKRGCGTCALHLVRDLGVMYFKQKAETPAPVKEEAPASVPEKVAETAQKANNAPKAGKSATKKKTPAKAKK